MLAFAQHPTQVQASIAITGICVAFLLGAMLIYRRFK